MAGPDQVAAWDGLARRSAQDAAAELRSLGVRVRLGGEGTELQRGTFLAALPILLGTTYVVYVVTGVYRRAWRYATPRDLCLNAVASAVPTRCP